MSSAVQVLAEDEGFMGAKWAESNERRDVVTVISVYGQTEALRERLPRRW